MSLVEPSTTAFPKRPVFAHSKIAAALPSVDELGGWQPVALAAEGSMSRIYRANPPGAKAPRQPIADNTGPAYAIKVLKEQWHDHPHAIELFVREARLGRAITDPHIISVLASRVKKSEPPYYLVMPWLEGRTLREELDEMGTYGMSETLWVARQTCEALATLQQAGYYHGDLKPSNLFVAPSGHLTLLDLGFARRTDEACPAADRVVAGTHLYMAPEATSSVYASSIQSDLYSLGAILFELLAGRPPFLGDTPQSLIEQHRSARPPRLSRLSPGVPPHLCDFIERLLAKHPDRRPTFTTGLLDTLLHLEIRMFSERAAM
jgi:serine/threonine-protein kinase